MSVVTKIRHVYINPPKADNHNYKPPRIIKAAVLTGGELERIKSHSQWLSKQSLPTATRHSQMEEMKNASKSLIKNWKNTVLNKQKEHIERRRKRIQDEEDRKNEIYKASLQTAAEDRRKRIEEARRMILFDRDDIQQLNSAFVLSETLRQREKQIEFNKNLRDGEAKAKQELAEQIKRDVQVHRQQMEELKLKTHEEKMKRKAENIRLMKEKAEREEALLISDKDKEKEDITEMEAELKQIQLNIQKELQRKKDHVKRNALESLALKEQKEKERKREEEDEDKVIQIYTKVKHRIECLRKKKEEEAWKAKLAHQEEIRKIIAESLKEKEDDTNRMVAKALKEKDEKEAEAIRRRQAYEAKLLKERQEYIKEVEEYKKKEAQEEKELKQWAVMQRIKRDEMDKLQEIKQKTSQWTTKMAVRQGYNSQIQEHIEKKSMEIEEDIQRSNALANQIQGEDSDFFKYAKEVVEECNNEGRPLYPVEKVIHEYRKKHGILQREKYDEWVKEKARLEEQLREEEQRFSDQLAIESTGSCDILIPDMKHFAPYNKMCPK